MHSNVLDIKSSISIVALNTITIDYSACYANLITKLSPISADIKDEAMAMFEREDVNNAQIIVKEHCGNPGEDIISKFGRKHNTI